MSEGTNRRAFVKEIVAGAALASLGSKNRLFAASARVKGANDAVRVAIVGIRSKGRHHIELFRAVPGVRLVALCDVDENLLGAAVKELAAENLAVKSYADFRKLIESKDVDAVVIATPNHWHSLMTVWACQAGKDVYVEKPVSHNVWEGRKAVEAARKYRRIVQTGTQSRSSEALQQVHQYLRQGELGRILRVRGFCYKRRPSIGKVAGPQAIPAGIDYNLWCGPAPLAPLMRQELHYDWHWVWPTGNGDIGNQGVHEMDMCRWMLGEPGLPVRVRSVGGRFGYDDDGNTPNTQISVLDYERAPIIFEVRGLPQTSGSENMDHYRGVRVGLVVECENGYFAGGGGGGWIHDQQGNRVKQFSSSGGEKHVQNFIEAVRSRKPTDLNAEILEGHLSSALCHLGNIPYQLGARCSDAELIEAFGSRPDVMDSLERAGAHLKANKVNITQARPLLGPDLQFLSEQERFVSAAAYDQGYWANQLLSRYYRPPFVMPEKV